MLRIPSEDNPLDILLIEDSRGDAVLIEKALAGAIPHARAICRVHNLSEALRMLTEKEFDVALLDRSLPDVTGFSGLMSLQNMAPHMPVIFLTAYKDEETAFKAVELGAQDYLFKDKLDGHVIKRAIQYAILRKQFEEVLIVRANFDTLTGLANRILFESRLDMALARMKRHPGTLGLLFLDLNGFKQINDSWGHLAGDKLLQQVGERLKKLIRPYDTAARLGGDEFALIIEDIGKEEHCASIAEKIMLAFKEDFIVSGRQTTVNVSIGITTCSPPHLLPRDTLLQRADEAMYEAKSLPFSNYRFYAVGHARAAPDTGQNFSGAS